MTKLFNVERPLMRLLARITDLVLLNLLFIATALPLVTIGAAWSSLLASWQRILRGQENSVTVNYFRLFRENLKQGTILWGIILVLSGTFFLDYLLLQQVTGGQRLLGLFVLMPFVFLLLALSSICFAYIGRYQDPLKQIAKNALAILVNFFPQILLVSAFNGLLIYGTVSSPERLLTAIYIATFFGFSLAALLNSVIMKTVFDRIEKATRK
ncbi:YesL family protein [Candidatus Enterococcus leclercqii]|uniref:YesL family protein n=1 Tax=Candidatus Enterococcus leclercqii TaxID=1857218 RepID=UPI00137A3959|nr:YesL family protein [Enterococcus sp. CU9D]KAF1292982.1 hypothetical protein BAU14_09250 [Enterococcus sp. CU9D]